MLAAPCNGGQHVLHRSHCCSVHVMTNFITRKTIHSTSRQACMLQTTHDNKSVPRSMAHVCAGNSITDQVAMQYQGQTGLKKWKKAVIAVVTVSGAALLIIVAAVLWTGRQAHRPAQIVRCKVFTACRMRCTTEGQLAEWTCIWHCRV